MLLFITWVTLSVIVGIAAGRKYNRNPAGWMVLSFVVSPLITFLLLVALGPVVPQQIQAANSNVVNWQAIDWNAGARKPTPAPAPTPQIAPLNKTAAIIFVGVLLTLAGGLILVSVI